MARSRSAGLGAVVAVFMAGCGSSGALVTNTAGLSCVDDSPRCVGERQAALRDMTSDTSKSWIQQPPTAAAYASGVRLFAYKTKKSELTCTELQRGITEANAGPAILRGPAGAGLSPAQVSRGVILAGEVSRELSRERSRRCAG
ncbi:MAG: hypothetical protein NW205_00930 [Hyphomicrobiaceae bacterium]|nr:hypothetical protein [Hyphomicrobiaceae bacterium]